MRLPLALLLACSAASLAAGQSYVQNAAQIPQGNPFNSSRTENVDFGDVDLDGDLDVVMADGGDGGNDQNRLWVNQGGDQAGTPGFFVDETATQFPLVLDHSRDIELADLDSDGDLDAFASNTAQLVNQGNRFLVNQGGLQAGALGFYADETQARWLDLDAPTTSIPAALLLAGGGYIDWSCDSDFADLDGDGDLDLVQSTYGGAFGGLVPTRMFQNDGAGFFREHNPSGFKLANQNIQAGDPALWAEGLQQSNTADASGAFADVASSALDIDLGDVDGDWDIDLLLGARQEPPRLFDNRLAETGAVVWRDVTGSDFQAGYVGGNGHYEQEFGDFDGDDDLDLYGLNWFDDFNDETLENVAGFYTNKTQLSGSGADDNEADFGDYDNDGDLDVFIANFSGQDRLYRNELVETGAATFALATSELPAYGKVSMDADFGDIDGDGDQDVMIGVEFNGANDLLENVTQVPDTQAPRCVNLEQVPDRIPSPLPTVVRVHVYDNAAYYATWYATVELEHRVGAGAWSAAAMRSSGGQVFRGEIPGDLVGTIEYRVRATDAGGNVGQSIAQSFSADDCGGAAQLYCTSKATSVPGCLPSLTLQGVPSASAPSGFVVGVGDVPGGQAGLFLYTTNGAAATPTQTPFGDLCLQPGAGLGRIGAQLSPGTTGVCNGAYAIDLNQYMATQTTDPALVAGATVDMQCWYRDPPNPGAANFTSAVGFTICP